MKIIPPVEVPTPVVPERTRVASAAAATESARVVSTPTQVDVSPSARVAAAMAAAGHYGRTGDEAVVEEIVGTGDPNAEFREQVFGLLVGMISRSRESEVSAREREEAMEASQQESAERVARAEAAMEDPGSSQGIDSASAELEAEAMRSAIGLGLAGEEDSAEIDAPAAAPTVEAPDVEAPEPSA